MIDNLKMAGWVAFLLMGSAAVWVLAWFGLVSLVMP